MALTEERRAALLAYCRLTELSDDPEVTAVIPVLYDAAVAYMDGAGVSPPAAGTAGPPSTTWWSTPWCWTPGTAGT